MRQAPHIASVLFVLLLSSCNKHRIVIEVVRRSSDLINCTKIFGYSVKKLEEENEILIQTGTHFGEGDEDDLPAAIVKVKGAEQILYLTGQSEISGERTEVYKGSGYALSLKYSEVHKGNREYYEGECRIKKGLWVSEYKLEGMDNVFDY